MGRLLLNVKNKKGPRFPPAQSIERLIAEAAKQPGEKVGFFYRIVITPRSGKGTGAGTTPSATTASD